VPPTNARTEVPKYEYVVLALQGGGALGAYQARVHEGLEKHRNDEDVKRLTAACAPHSIAWVRLVNDGSARASAFKDVDFSHGTVTELWKDGLNDVRRTMRHKTRKAATEVVPGFHFFEVTAA
jgi:hypothetical protein